MTNLFFIIVKNKVTQYEFMQHVWGFWLIRTGEFPVLSCPVPAAAPEPCVGSGREGAPSRPPALRGRAWGAGPGPPRRALLCARGVSRCPHGVLAVSHSVPSVSPLCLTASPRCPRGVSRCSPYILMISPRSGADHWTQGRLRAFRRSEPPRVGSQRLCPSLGIQILITGGEEVLGLCWLIGWCFGLFWFLKYNLRYWAIKLYNNKCLAFPRAAVYV